MLKAWPTTVALLLLGSLGLVGLIVPKSVSAGEEVGEPRSEGRGGIIQSRFGNFDPVSESWPLPPSLQGIGLSRRYFVVQFDGPMDTTRWSALGDVTAGILEYIPDHS